jgi:hypothetical protein
MSMTHSLVGACNHIAWSREAVDGVGDGGVGATSS